MGLPLKLACAVTVCFLLVWCTSIPLGVPGEWTWTRSRIADDFAFSLIPAFGWAIVFCSVVWIGSGRIERSSRWQITAWLAGLFVTSFGLLSALQEAAPPEFRGAKVAWVLYYPGSSGYFTEARKVQNTAEFLAHYEQELQKGDVLHQGTHPPGLVVGYRGLMWICGHSAALRQFLLWTQPEDLKEAFRVIAATSARTPTPLTELDRCVIWLAALLMQACAAATVIPLLSLLRLFVSRTASWQLTSFWPIVPAVAIFLPKSDTCFPFIGCVVLALWLHGLKKGSLVLCIAAGCIFWLGMVLSLALLPVGFLAAVLTAWLTWGCVPEVGPPNATRRVISGLVAGGSAFVILTTATWLLASCNLANVWVWNYRNHAGFYAQFPRTYWKWLLVNPLELAVATGLPLIILALCSLRIHWKQPRTAAGGPFWMSLLAWCLLWLTGKNMGEAARLWIFLMPWIIWSAGTGWQALITSDEQAHRDTRQTWLLCWICQFLTALIIITRVAGFQAFG